MTNRQWLAGLSDEALADKLSTPGCPKGCNVDNCSVGGCVKCWKDWLRAECDIPTTAFYDVIEEHHGCTVQVLKNSVTGEMSVGWKKG